MDDDIKLGVYSCRIALIKITHLLRPKGPRDESHWPLLTQKSMVAGVVGCTKCAFLQSNIKISLTDTSSPALPISLLPKNRTPKALHETHYRGICGVMPACHYKYSLALGKKGRLPYDVGPESMMSKVPWDLACSRASGKAGEEVLQTFPMWETHSAQTPEGSAAFGFTKMCHIKFEKKIWKHLSYR